MKKGTIKWLVPILLFLIISGAALFPLPPQKPVEYVQRESGQLKTEKIAGEKWLVWLYYNPIGEATLWALVKRKMVSAVYGNMMDAPSSIEKIAPFAKDFNVDLSIAQKQNFSSFNDFFIRKLKPETRPLDMAQNAVLSPADGKVLAYQNISESDFFIKGYRFNVFTFLDNQNAAKKYENGAMVIVRLAPTDYHRYHFPVSGTISFTKKIDGQYYSVNPLALRKNAEIFCLNKREYTIISTTDFGDVGMVEVGATMVGSMVQTFSGNTVLKGDEKGYFKFGGSTVVLLFEKNKISLDQDLLKNTSNGLETTVKMGERIARKL